MDASMHVMLIRRSSEGSCRPEGHQVIWSHFHLIGWLQGRRPSHGGHCCKARQGLCAYEVTSEQRAIESH